MGCEPPPHLQRPRGDLAIGEPVVAIPSTALQHLDARRARTPVRNNHKVHDRWHLAARGLEAGHAHVHGQVVVAWQLRAPGGLRWAAAGGQAEAPSEHQCWVRIPHESIAEGSHGAHVQVHRQTQAARHEARRRPEEPAPRAWRPCPWLEHDLPVERLLQPKNKQCKVAEEVVKVKRHENHPGATNGGNNGRGGQNEMQSKEEHQQRRTVLHHKATGSKAPLQWPKPHWW
mmetsp:Transcript_42634/g.121546  ORF Transcript_42634/g.121546 Transcript_42634/m.121546 type:complete len:230 (+) Transcript_42634:1234-1923(+)